jgi:hypothetical protein
MNKHPFIILVSVLLSSCTTEQETLHCSAPRDLEFGTFQVTWFTEPVRDWTHHGGAVFDDDSGTIKAPGPERSGHYCIENKTLYFQTYEKANPWDNEGQPKGIEQIEILYTDGETMVLEFEDGTQFTYHNPPTTAADVKALDEFLKEAYRKQEK